MSYANPIHYYNINNYISDLETLDKEIIKPFSSRSSASAVDTVTDSMRFEEYCASYPEGIFLNALVAKSSTDWLKEVTCTLLQFIHSPLNYVNNLRQVCSLKVHFSQFIFQFTGNTTKNLFTYDCLLLFCTKRRQFFLKHLL